MVIRLEVSFDVGNGTLIEINKSFCASLKIMYQAIVKKAVELKKEQAKQDGTLEKIFGSPCSWKSKSGKLKTHLITEYGKIIIPDFQIMLHVDKTRHLISRILLGIERYARIPKSAEEKYAALFAHCSTRAAQALAKTLTGASVSAKTVRRCANTVADCCTLLRILLSALCTKPMES